MTDAIFLFIAIHIANTEILDYLCFRGLAGIDWCFVGLTAWRTCVAGLIEYRQRHNIYVICLDGVCLKQLVTDGGRFAKLVFLFFVLNVVIKLYKIHVSGQLILAKNGGENHAFCPNFLPSFFCFYIVFEWLSCILHHFTFLFCVLLANFLSSKACFLLLNSRFLALFLF